MHINKLEFEFYGFKFEILLQSVKLTTLKNLLFIYLQKLTHTYIVRAKITEIK